MSAVRAWLALGGLWRWLIFVALLSPATAMAAPLEQPAPTNESPFKRIDEFPPEDFLAALGWAGGGAGLEGTHCRLHPSGEITGETYPETKPCVLGLNDILQLTLDESFDAQGWKTQEPVTITVAQPDGSIAPETEDEFGNLVWSIDLEAPTGVYSVRARQGSRTASGTFRVALRTGDPVIRVFPETRWTGGPLGGAVAAAPGTALFIVMAGFAPNQTIKLMLFDGGENHVYRTTLATLRADAAGRAVHRLVPSQDDQGAYTFQTAPISRGVAFPTGFGAEVCFSPPAIELSCWQTPESSSLLFQRLISQSNQLWASVGARDGAPLAALRCVFKGNYLDSIRGSLFDMRQRGEYLVARETAPPTILKVTKLEAYEQYSVDVVEHLSAVIYAADGSFVEDWGGEVPHRYTFSQDYEVRHDDSMPPACLSGWVITDDAA